MARAAAGACSARTSRGLLLSPRRRGAQNVAHMLAPDPALLERLRGVAGDTLRMVTIAPELPGALPLIAAASRRPA